MNNKIERKQRAQSYAVRIEDILKCALGCERGAYEGRISSDSIRNNPLDIMKIALETLYLQTEENQEIINKFMEKFGFYKDMSMDDILSLDYADVKYMDDSEDEVKYIIEEFKKLLV